jgi:hypothetical protein
VCVCVYVCVYVCVCSLPLTHTHTPPTHTRTHTHTHTQTHTHATHTSVHRSTNNQDGKVKYLPQESDSFLSARREEGTYTIATHTHTQTHTHTHTHTTTHTHINALQTFTLTHKHSVAIEERALTNPVRIRQVIDPNHPCYGQRGLYCVDHPGEDHDILIEYTGSLCNYQTRDSKSHYVMQHGIYATDAGQSGNQSRFINDYRGCELFV